MKPEGSSCILILGHRASGKSQAIRELEELGYRGMDNLPTLLLSSFSQWLRQSPHPINYAIAVEPSLPEDLQEIESFIATLRSVQISCKLILLNCTESVALERIRKRGEELPKEPNSFSRILLNEKQLLNRFKEKSLGIVDTSYLHPADLGERLVSLLNGGDIERLLQVELFSFGFKYGIPPGVDMLFDVRFIPNPYYIPELRDTTGLDPACASFVLNHPSTSFFVDTLGNLLYQLIPSYLSAGKAKLSIGIGCTGGQHRSVAIVEALSKALQKLGVSNRTYHRELNHNN